MELLLHSGDHVQYDDEDHNLVSRYEWRVRRSGPRLYAASTCDAKGEILGHSILMHRLIMGSPAAPLLVDHRNLDGLDNRKDNLRIVDASYNAQNRRRLPGKSKYKGVFPDRQKWRAAITKRFRKKQLGTYDDEEDAARAYDAAALELFGEQAYVNFPDETHRNSEP
jgi:AP2-like factor (euAP2 lineage)